MSQESDLQRFLDLSVVLTGFSAVELLGTGMERIYLDTVHDAAGGSVVTSLLHTFEELIDGGGDLHLGIRTRILGDPRLGPVAQNVISLWYTGNWTELPQPWPNARGASAADLTRVVSAESYQQGLVWIAAGTHPQGARQPGFGTWAEPPIRKN